VDHVRRKHGLRRGGSRGRRPLADEDLVAIPLTAELVDLDDALAKLRAADPAAADLVTMRVFGGMTVEEIAAAQGTSPRTVKRNWAYARAWLGRELAAYDPRVP
jgi:RNA polymerase sigma factor (TIGR02999 family)